MKGKIFIMTVAFFLLAVGFSWAGQVVGPGEFQGQKGVWYIPSRGETPGGVAKKIGGRFSLWREICHINGFSERSMPTGRKIFVPVWQGKVAGNSANKVAGNNPRDPVVIRSLGRAPLNPYFQKEYNWELVAKSLNLSLAEKEELEKLFKEAEKKENISSGRTGIVFVSAQKNPRWSRFLFRNGKSKKNAIPGWKGEEPGIRATLSNGRIFEFMWKCGNIGEVIRAEKAEPVPCQSQPESQPPTELEQEKERVKRERVELYLGAGKYRAFNYDSGGWYGWGQLGIYPFGSFFPKDNFEVMPGIMAWYGLGKGHDRDYDYRWREVNIGPALKVFGQGWDTDVQIGFSYLVNKGGVSKYSSHQRDWSFHPRVHFNNYSREDAGKDWFPRWEADLTARIPFETSHRHWWDGERLKDNPTDQTRITAEVKPWIRRLYLDQHQTSSVLIGAKFGVEHLFAQNGYQNIFLGPLVRLDLLDKEVVEVSPFTPQFSTLTDSWSWSVSGWIYPQGLYRWWKARGIKELPKNSGQKNLLDYEGITLDILQD